MSEPQAKTRTGHDILVQINSYYKMMPQAISAKERAELERLENQQWVSLAEYDELKRKIEIADMQFQSRVRTLAEMMAKELSYSEYKRLQDEKNLALDELAKERVRNKTNESQAKTDLTKQELMRIFEEQIELKNAEIQRLEGVLSDIRKHYENFPDVDVLKMNLAIKAWKKELGVLLNQPKSEAKNK